MSEETIKVFYERDHDRLDGLFQQFQQKKNSDFTKAKDAFRQFRHGLLRHILWEEEILFPLLEDKTGQKNFGPTTVMRAEHVQIKEILDLIHEKVRNADPQSDSQASSLLEVLGAHNMKEESILYPMADSFLSESDRRVIYQRMERITAETQGSCCQGPHLSENQEMKD